MKKLIIILLLACSTGLNAQWKKCENGLDGGMILSIISNEGRLIAGTTRGVYYSTNSGDNWIYSPGDDFGALSVIRIQKLYAANGKIFAATEVGLYYSTDNGENWLRTNFGFDPVVSVEANNDYIFGSSAYGAVKRSSDGGQTWERIDELIPQSYGPSLAFDYIYMYLGGNSGLYKSSNNGSTWDPVTIDNSSTRSIDFLKYITGKLYVNISSKLYISQDLGMSWQTTELDLSSNRIYDITTNGEYIFAATYAGVIRSKDGITDWSFAGKIDRNEILSICGRDGAIYAGTYDGVFRSEDDGKTWTSKSVGIKSIDFYSLYAQDNSVYAGSYYSGLHYSDDGGENWKRADLKKDFMQSIAGSDNKIYVAANFSINRWDRESGNWKDISQGTMNVSASSFVTNGPEVYGGGMNGAIYSSNYGDSWNSTELPSTISCLALYKGDLLAGSSSQTIIYRSKDKGKSWTPIVVDPGLIHFVQSILIHSNRIYVGTSEGLYVSGDDGLTWDRLENGLLNDNIFKLASSGEHIFAGTIGGLFHSSDGGASWIDVNRNLSFGEIKFLAASGENIYVANSERSLYRAKIADLFKGSAEDAPSNIPLTLSPSPAWEYVILPETDIPNQEAFVYSILGVKVFTGAPENGKLKVGALSPGIYFLEYGVMRYRFVKG